MNFTGRIKKIVITGKKPHGYIYSPDANIHWKIDKDKDVVFWEDGVISGLFSSLSIGDIVEFHTDTWTRQNGDVRIRAKQVKASKIISLINAKTSQLPVITSTTELLKDKIINFLNKIETVSNPFEFEDLVFNLLRLIGINKIYQYDRNNAAGRADGVFISGNLAVIYDCKLNSQFRQNSQTQMFNYKNQLKQASSITIDEKRVNGKVITRTLSIPKNREVWFITRGNTSIIQNTDNICVREVSVKSLIDIFNQKLDSRMFGQLN